MQDLTAILCSLKNLIITWLNRRNYGQYSEDVAHEMVCEVLRQPCTRQFVIDHATEIMGGMMPPPMRRRIRSKAHRLIPPLAHIEETDTLLVMDDTTARDLAVLAASWEVEELILQDPWLGEVVKAQRDGCWTWREVSKYLGISERTFYSRLQKARRLRDS